MARSAILLAALLLGTVGLAAAKVNVDVDVAKERPVSKVITLLKDMLSQLEKEAEEDEDVYKKLACWCTTNDKEKKESIAAATAKIADLSTTIEELSANSARLNVEIKNLKKELKKNQESLEAATELRKKQLAAFVAEEKDMLGSISQLKSALTAFSKGASLLQVRSNTVQTAAATVQTVMQKHVDLVSTVLTHSQRATVAAFLQSSSNARGPLDGITGILGQMRESFEGNLAKTQAEEQKQQKAFEALKAAKQAEIAAGKDQINSKSLELANTDETLARSKQDLKDTKESLVADEQFLAMLKEKCQVTDAEWAERQKTRQQEIEAVSKALSILSGDDAHDVFTRTFNPAMLLQKAASTNSQRRAKAAALIQAAATKAGSQQLADLATRVRLDAFERVKKAIDDLVTQLLKEKDDEIKKRDFCIEELRTNQLQIDESEREKQSLLAKIADLKATIESIADDVDTLKREIAEAQKQLKKAGENRDRENKDFQAAVADQRETQKLLEAALEVLTDFYGKSFLQMRARQPAPAGFDEYKKSGASTKVIDLLKQIIKDAQVAEKENQRAEQEAQAAYEAFVQDTNASIDAKGKEIVNKSEAKAKAESDLVTAKESKESVVLRLEELDVSKKQLHQSCDFVLQNFELRQKAFTEEVEALRQAVAILSGAKL